MVATPPSLFIKRTVLADGLHAQRSVGQPKGAYDQRSWSVWSYAQTVYFILNAPAQRRGRAEDEDSPGQSARGARFGGVTRAGAGTHPCGSSAGSGAARREA